MKLAIVSTLAAVSWGGSEELWTRVAARALAEGHSVLASVGRWRPRPAKIQELAAAGARLDERVWLRSSRVQMAYNRRVKRFGAVGRFNPDVVLLNLAESSHLGSMLGARTVRLLTRNFRVPYVALSQAGDEYRVSGGGGDDDEDRALALGAAGMWYVSRRNLEVFERMHCCRLPRGAVVRNPVNISDISPVPWPKVSESSAKPPPARFCLPGRLSVGAKGQDVLLDALSRDPWRQRNWTITFYGTGPDEAYLRRYAEHAGLGERVRLAGFTDDIRSVWSEHELLVMPSRVEGTPLTLVEAMLCGRPAVVTDIGGNAEWVRDGENGFVARGLTVASVSDALERAWAARDRWAALGATAREDARRLNDPDTERTLLNRLSAIATAPASAGASADSTTRAIEMEPAQQK